MLAAMALTIFAMSSGCVDDEDAIPASATTPELTATLEPTAAGRISNFSFDASADC